MKKIKYLSAITLLLFIIVINLAITTTIYRFKNPTLTQTQLTLKIPQTFFWDFK